MEIFIKNKKIVFGILLIVFIIIILILIFGNSSEVSPILSFVSLVGSFSSIAGLIWIFFEIIKLNKIAKNTNKIIIDTRKKIFSYDFISVVSKSIEIVHKIIDFNNSSRFELSILKLQDFSYFLHQIKNNDTYSRLEFASDIDKHIKTINLQKHSLNDELSKKTRKLKVLNINRELREISEFLMNVDTIVKQNVGGKNES